MPIRVQMPDGGIAEFPDDMSKADIESALAGVSGEPESAFARDFPKMAAVARSADAKNRELGPAAGAMTAAALTGGASLPVQALAAAGGGYLGARGRGDSRSDAAVSGALQGALTPIGAGAAWAAGKAGPAIYRGLLKPSKAIRDSFGADSVVRTLMDEGATITRRGADKMVDLMGLSRGKALDAVRAAEQAGAPGVPAQDVVREFAPVAKELRNRVDIGQANELARIGQRGKALVQTAGKSGGTIPLSKAQTMKETAQDASSGAYRQMDRGTVKQLSGDDLLDTATARGLKTAIERRVPGVKDINTQTQRYIGGSRALEDALERSSNNNAIGGMKDLIAVGGGMGVGGLTGDSEKGVATAALIALLTRPSAGSLGAIGLDRLSRQQLDQWMRAALAGISSGQ